MRPTQTILAVLSVALGVAAFATVAAIDAWQRQQIRALALDFAPDVLVVRVTTNWPEDVEFVPGQNFGLLLEEAAALSQVPGVADMAFQSSAGRVLGDVVSIQRVPVTHTFFDVLGLEFAVGEPFGEDAVLFDLPFAVIGVTVAEELFGSAEEAVGQIMSLGGQASVRVEAVLERIPAGVEEFQYLNASALLPHSPSYAFTPLGRPAASRAFIRHEPGAAELAMSGLRAALDELPTGRLYEIVDSETWLASQQLFRNRIADELTRGSAWVVLLALVATLGNLANTLGLRAADRARSMAVRRALGATRPRIAAEIILDGLMIGGAGTVLGLALWPLIDRIVSLGGEALRFTPGALLLAAGAGMAVTLLAVIVPAIWSLRLPVYRALREDVAPPVWEGVALTGMAAGVLALVVASSITTGTEMWFRQRLAEVGADRVVMTTIGGPVDRRTSALSPPPFDAIDAANIASLPGVLGVATAALDSSIAIVLDAVAEPPQIELVTVARVSDTFFEVNPKPIEFGRAPATPDEVIIGPRAAEWAHPGVPLDQIVGMTMELARQWGGDISGNEVFTISGVFADRGWDSFGDLFDGAIVRMARPDDPPLTAAISRDMHIRVDLSADYDAVLANIRDVVNERHEQYGPAVLHEPAGDLGLVRATMAGVGQAWNVMAWLSLMVGGAGLASVVIVRLVRSRSELALKRALGATQTRVATISTGMALRIAGYASLVGLTLAGMATWWIATLAPWGFFWPWLESATALLTALLVALIAVSAPVFALSRTSPWSVLKEE